MARQVTGAWYGADAELPEPSLSECIEWAANMAILNDDEPSAYDDDPRVLYRSRSTDIS